MTAFLCPIELIIHQITPCQNVVKRFMVHRTLPESKPICNMCIKFYLFLLIIDNFTSPDIDECTPNNPCQNNGTCINTPGSYTCCCAPGWTGPNCKEGKQVGTQYLRYLITHNDFVRFERFLCFACKQTS